MSERTTVVNPRGGSAVNIFANVVVTILILAAVLWLGGNAHFPSQISVGVNQPQVSTDAIAASTGALESDGVSVDVP